MKVEIRAAQPKDLPDWAALRAQLWSSDSVESHREELENDFSDSSKKCFLAIVSDQIVGFIELSLRSAVDGCASSPVAYIEGWYVRPEFRRAKIGSQLVAAAERWGRERGCSEIGSDTELHNDSSIRAHAALGFEEVDRVVQFRKSL